MKLPVPKMPDRYNVRIVTRLPFGGEVTIEMREVPRVFWQEHFGPSFLLDYFGKTDEVPLTIEGSPAAIVEALSKGKP